MVAHTLHPDSQEANRYEIMRDRKRESRYRPGRSLRSCDAIRHVTPRQSGFLVGLAAELIVSPRF